MLVFAICKNFMWAKKSTPFLKLSICKNFAQVEKTLCLTPTFYL